MGTMEIRQGGTGDKRRGLTVDCHKEDPIGRHDRPTSRRCQPINAKVQATPIHDDSPADILLEVERKPSAK